MAASTDMPGDLTFLLGSFLDRHLVFPLLEFLQEKEVRRSAAPRGLEGLDGAPRVRSGVPASGHVVGALDRVDIRPPQVQREVNASRACNIWCTNVRACL